MGRSVSEGDDCLTSLFPRLRGRRVNECLLTCFFIDSPVVGGGVCEPVVARWTSQPKLFSIVSSDEARFRDLDCSVSSLLTSGFRLWKAFIESGAGLRASRLLIRRMPEAQLFMRKVFVEPFVSTTNLIHGPCWVKGRSATMAYVHLLSLRWTNAKSNCFNE